MHGREAIYNKVDPHQYNPVWNKTSVTDNIYKQGKVALGFGLLRGLFINENSKINRKYVP